MLSNGLNSGQGIDGISRARLMKRASYASVAVAAVLVVAKLVVWLYIGSVAFLGSLVDSFLDLIASLTTLMAIRQALEPADYEHRFGHGKVEAIASLGQGAVIMASAVFLAYQSIERLITPVAISRGNIGIAVLVLSIVLTILLVNYQRSVARQTGSLAVSADSLHYRSDLIMNLAVIVAIVLADYFDLAYVDPLFGLAIAAYIGYGAFEIGHHAYDMLMDREMPDADRVQIKLIALTHKRVKNLHDLRTRQSGFNQFIQLHIELDPEIRLKEAHDISDEVEASIAKAYPDAEILIHIDPAGLEAPHKGIGAGR
jgi:ferrous-iron efflux pump FieF